jgi:DNA polymerase-3 subunit delta'
MASGRAPDFQVIEPYGPGRLIKLNAIVDRPNSDFSGIPITEFFRTPPLSARMKVVFLQDCDRMNADSANGLLKTLEEPHPHARILLATTAIGSLLPTIRSRCLSIHCALPEQDCHTAEDAEWMVRASNRSPVERERFRTHREIFEQVALLVDGRVEQVPRSGIVASETLLTLAQKLSDATGDPLRKSQADVLDVFGRLMRHEDCSPAFRLRIAEAHRRILGNGQAGLIFDALFTVDC